MIQNLENEVWATHPKYKKYAASNYGRIKSLERDVVDVNGKIRHYEEKLIKPSKDKDGYLKFKLSRQFEKEIYPKVHRFVYEAFHQCIILDDLEVNHKSEKRYDNFIENLELLDHKSNINYGTRNKRASEALTNRKDLSKKVGQYDLEGNLIKIWKSTRECERNDFDHSTVSKCCRGKINKYKGFIWKYI